MITVRAFTSDVAVPGYLRLARIRDEILTPISSGKTLATAETWQGALRPKLDYFVEQTEKATRGFALGHVVGAEPAPGNADLGTVWNGFIDLRDTLLRAVDSKRVDGGEWNVDLDEIFRELEAFRASVGSKPDMATMSNAVDRLKRARDAADARLNAARSTSDAQSFLRRSREAASQAFAKIRTGAAQRYGTADQRTTTRDSMTDVRDAVDAAHRATNPRDQIRAINAANTAFHAPRTSDHLAAALSPHPGTRGALQRQISQGGGGSGAMTPAEINRRNREHYAKGR
jgi:hypothetical protein